MEDIEKILSQISDGNANCSHVFADLTKTFDVKTYAQILNELLEISDNTIASKNIIIEINKREMKENLPALNDFILSKTNKDFKNGFDTVDLASLKVMCVKTMGKFGDKTSVSALLYCLNNGREDYKFRLAAAEALGKIGDSHAVESLINVVKNDNEKSVYLRESAALALGMIGDLRAIDPLINFLQGNNALKSKFSFLRERIIEALGNFAYHSDRRITDALEDALFDKSSQVRLNALETISNSNCTELFSQVKSLLTDDDEEVAKGAVITLYNLSGADILNEIINDNSFPTYTRQQAREILDEYE